MAVGWYPVGMWLFIGLGVLFVSFLHVLLQWLPLLQLLQNTPFVHLFLMWPCSLHLKHVGPFLLFDEFGESLNKPLRSAILVMRVGNICCVAVSLPVFRHGPLQPVVVVVPPVRCATGALLAPWIIELLTGGSYRLVRLVGSVVL